MDKELLGAPLPSEGKALVVGIGDGDNTVFLAKRGLDVDAVDISREKAKDLKQRIKRLKLPVRVFVRDVSNFNCPARYEVIVSFSTLHFLRRSAAFRVISSFKVHTSAGGINILKVFTKKDPGSRKFKEKMYFFSKGELKRLYRDWEILKYREYFTPFEIHGSNKVRHRHHVAAIIAKKPAE